jgi:hypothetical protein
MSYPKYYDALYYPELYPEIFFSANTVKNWLESSLTSHSSVCKICIPVSCVSQIKFQFFAKTCVIWSVLL